MSSRTPEPRRGPEEGPALPADPATPPTRSSAWRATALAGTLLVAGVAAIESAVGAEGPHAPAFPSTLQVRDTTPEGDLLCLTRRAEDCLDEPVPADEPHGAVCSTCHDLWEGEPGDVRSCTDAGCHEAPARLSVFHGTVDVGALTECTDCHRAHAFRIPEDGQDCRVCHQGGGELPAGDGHVSPSPGPAEALGFTHVDHTTVACATCHGTGQSHTVVRLEERADCRSCHHAPSDDDSCLSCHVLDEVVAVSFAVERELDIRVGSLDRPRRLLPFDHGDHWAGGCTTCHTGGPDLGTARGADCSGCHFEHHEPGSTCSTCHERPAEGAHDRQAHLGCGGTGCHDPVPPGLVPAPRTRSLCLACHGDRADHQPDRPCAGCHILPAPVGAAAGAVSPRGG